MVGLFLHLHRHHRFQRHCPPQRHAVAIRACFHDVGALFATDVRSLPGRRRRRKTTTLTFESTIFVGTCWYLLVLVGTLTCWYCSVLIFLIFSSQFLPPPIFFPHFFSPPGALLGGRRLRQQFAGGRNEKVARSFGDCRGRRSELFVVWKLPRLRRSFVGLLAVVAKFY